MSKVKDYVNDLVLLEQFEYGMHSPAIKQMFESRAFDLFEGTAFVLHKNMLFTRQGYNVYKLGKRQALVAENIDSNSALHFFSRVNTVQDVLQGSLSLAFSGSVQAPSGALDYRGIIQ